MNVLVVDTSSWISFFKGLPQDDLNLALKEGRVHLPPVVAAELLGAHMRTEERQQLADFLRELPLCGNDFDHWTRVGELRSALAKKGVNLSTPDAHIAQCTLDLDGYLLTEDQVFNKIAKLKQIPVSS